MSKLPFINGNTFHGFAVSAERKTKFSRTLFPDDEKIEDAISSGIITVKNLEWRGIKDWHAVEKFTLHSIEEGVIS